MGPAMTLGRNLRMVPTQGGASMLIAKGAYSPRFSPESKSLAYSTLNGDSAAHVYVVDPAQSSQPLRVDSGVPSSARNRVGGRICPLSD
jgi:hypothetical protein